MSEDRVCPLNESKYCSGCKWEMFIQKEGSLSGIGYRECAIVILAEEALARRANDE